MKFAMARRSIRGLLTGLAVLVTACGGGGGGVETKTVTVDFRYADVQGDTRVPLTVTPVLTGLEGREPTCSASGVIPPGMTFDPSTCRATGTPTDAGTYTLYVTLTVRNVQGALTESAKITIVDPTPGLSPDMTNLVLTGPAGADLSLNYGQPIPPTSISTISSNSPARAGDVLTYAVVDGVLPSGITLDSTTGKVQGTPTGFGMSWIGIAATLHRNGVAYTSQTIGMTLTVHAMALAVSYPSCTAIVGTMVTCTPALGNPAAFAGLSLAYTTADPFPAGLAMNPSTGVISGVLTANFGPLVNLRATYPNGTTVDLQTRATVLTTSVNALYDPTPANVAVADGPTFDGFGVMRVQVRAGQAFSIEVTGFSHSLPGDARAFDLLPFDNDVPLPSWISVDPATGRLFGIAPAISSEIARFVPRLVLTRGGFDYSSGERWIVVTVP